jgi:PAS domain S-box-containing protein
MTNPVEARLPNADAGVSEPFGSSPDARPEPGIAGPADRRAVGDIRPSRDVANRAVWPWLVLLAALAASFGLWKWLHLDDVKEASRRGHVQAQRVIDAFEADLAKLELTARAVVATVGTGVQLDGSGWARYVDGLDLGDVYGDAILAVAFAERVPRALLAAHVERLQRAHPGYAVVPADVRDTYYPIVLLRRITEPGIPAPIGFDPFAVPERRAAMAEALAKRGIAYSGAMVQTRAALPANAGTPDSAPGVVLVAPVFPANAAGPETGFVGITLRPDRLIARSIGTTPGIGATLTLTHGERGPVQLTVGNTTAVGDVAVRETAEIARGGARWRLDVVATETVPARPALLAATIGGACALFALSVAIERTRRRVHAAVVNADADGEARFRDLADNAPFMLWVSDTKMKPTYVNDAWSATTGQPSGIARGHGWRDFVHPDDLPAITATFRAMMGAPAPCTVRGRMRTQDGSYRWHLAHVLPRRDADGNHIGFVGISFDVHELQSAELALERERALLRGVLDGSPACIFAKDEAHRYILMNPAVAALRGMDHEQFLGRTDSEFFSPETAALYLAQDDEVMHGGIPLRLQEAYEDASGHRRWMLKTKNLVTLSSGERMLVGWALDVTDIKRLESEAATARRRIEALHRLATRTLAGDGPAALAEIATHAIASLIPGTTVRMVPMTDAGAGPSLPRLLDAAPETLAHLRSGRAIVLPGGPPALTAEACAALQAADARARIAAPLGRGDHLRGALSIEAGIDRAWGSDDVEIAVEIAEALAAALEFCDSRAERDRAEHALNESRLLLDGIIEALPVGLSVKDEAGRWILTNDALATLTGRPTDSMLGRTNADIFPPDVAEIFEREDAEVLRTGASIAVEWRISNPASQRPWVVKVKSRLTMPDGRRFLISAMTDITPQKQAMLEVERSRRFLDALLNALPQAVYVRNVAGMTILANQAYYDLTLRTPDEVIGRTARDIYGDDIGDMLDSQDADAWAAGRSVTLEQKTRDPRVVARWQLKSKTPITMDDGSRYLVGVSNDITPLKQAVADLERSKQFVEALIDAVPQGIYVKDAEGRWIVVNEPFLRLSNLTREVIIGRTNVDIYGPVDGARFDEQDAVAWRATTPLLFEEAPSRYGPATGTWHSKSKAAMSMADGSRFLICTLTDASDRRSADLALQRNRAFLSAIIDAMPALVFVKDAEHRFVMMNSAAERDLGRRRGDLIGRTDADLLPPEQAARATAEDDAVLAGAAPITTEQMIRFGDGPVRWLLMTKVATTLDDGSRCVISVNLDITARKRAEQEALEARSRLEVLNGIAADMTAEVPLTTLVTGAMTRMSDALGGVAVGFWSRSASDTYALTTCVGPLPEDVVNGGVFRIAVTPARLEALERGDVIVADGDASEHRAPGHLQAFVVVPIRSTQSPRPRAMLSLSAEAPHAWCEHDRQTIMEVGEALTLALLKADADAEHARVEADLRDSEAVLRATVWASDLGLWSLDLVDHKVRFSTRWKSQLGFEPGELADRLETWNERLHPDDRAGANQAMTDAIASGGGRYQAEFRLLHRDGTWRNILSRAQIQRDADGRAVRMVGGHIDVTDYRRAQEDLRQHRDELELIVAERTAEAVRAKELAEGANRAKSEFLANMSHELRTPMHAILSFSRLGQDRMQNGTAQLSKIATYLARIEQSGQRLLGLLNDLLDLSKLESGKMRYEFALHDLRDIVATVASELAGYAHERGVIVAIVPVAAPVRARCDAERIGQVVRNLLSNAIRFTAAGLPVTMEVRGGECLAAADGPPRDAVLIRVVDEGIGIPDDELEAVFDKFVQSSKTASGAGGTGLGLAICREIAAHHGGRIWADNNPGNGASFSLLIPVEPLPDPGPPTHADTAA